VRCLFGATTRNRLPAFLSNVTECLGCQDVRKKEGEKATGSRSHRLIEARTRFAPWPARAFARRVWAAKASILSQPVEQTNTSVNRIIAGIYCRHQRDASCYSDASGAMCAGGRQGSGAICCIACSAGHSTPGRRCHIKCVSLRSSSQIRALPW
jgi:hypothetical protein